MKKTTYSIAVIALFSSMFLSACGLFPIENTSSTNSKNNVELCSQESEQITPTAMDPSLTPESTSTSTAGLNLDDLESHQSGFVLFYNSKENDNLEVFDLDFILDASKDPAAPDIQLVWSGGSDNFLSLLPINGSMKMILDGEMGLADCYKNLEHFTKGNIPNYREGTICILTNQNRIGIIRYIGANLYQKEKGNGYLVFSYTIWDLSIDELQ